MWKNYLKIAWRSLQKQRFYAVINILGLSAGITCCLLISLFVAEELSYDRFNEKAERIYRVYSDINFGGKREQYAVAQAPLAQALRDEVPEVETACRFRQRGSWLIRREGTVQNIKEESVVYTEAQTFDVFTLPLLYGERSSLLAGPNTLAMSESAAKRHFGDVNPLGQTLLLNNEQPYIVSGVYKDIPQASHFHYDFMLSMDGLEEARSPFWLSHNFQTYLLAKPGSDTDAIQGKINAMFRKYAAAQLKQAIGASIEELEAQGNWARYALMPLTRIHLHSKLIVEHEPNSDIAYVWIFSLIALFILVIACINFMNLATARSAGRAKEVGMRKVLGSERKQLVAQFLAEALTMSTAAFGLAVLFAALAMPFFNQLTGRKLYIPYLDPFFIGAVLAGALFTGLLAGSYPAFFLSAFRPIEVLRGKMSSHKGSNSLRSGLVVFQFAISTLLITGTLVIYRQLNFIQNKNLGFNREQVLLLYDTYALGEKFNGFKNEMEQMREVSSLSAGCYLPVSSCRNETTLWVAGKSPDQSSLSVQCWGVDYGYPQTLGMEIVQGRFFSKDFSTDTTAVVLNETAAAKFDFNSADPIGQQIGMFTDEGLENATIYTVIGVVKDFHFESLRENISPLAFFLNDRSTGMLSVRFDPAAGTSDFIETVRSKYEALAPGQPFNYSFLDSQFTRMYNLEQRLGRIFIVFAGLAIFIACLGLLALAAFTAEKRTKEIGIRKVLGASATGIVTLLSKDFLKLVLIAISIALPAAWYFMRKWLLNFAYHIEIGWWVFASAGVTAVLVAVLTVAMQSARAALANPVESLRSE